MIAGSQDSIGIAVPGLSRADYDGAYWPIRISRRGDEHLLRFIEDSLYLVPLGERSADYNPLEGTHLTVEGARALTVATEACWDAIHREDRAAMGAAMRASFEAQVSLFPRMMNPVVAEMIARYRDHVLGWKLSGAGGGGYLVLVSDAPVNHAIRLTIRREMS
jgi:hypothetical protein